MIINNRIILERKLIKARIKPTDRNLSVSIKKKKKKVSEIKAKKKRTCKILYPERYFPYFCSYLIVQKLKRLLLIFLHHLRKNKNKNISNE